MTAGELQTATPFPGPPPTLDERVTVLEASMTVALTAIEELAEAAQRGSLEKEHRALVERIRARRRAGESTP